MTPYEYILIGSIILAIPAGAFLLIQSRDNVPLITSPESTEEPARTHVRRIQGLRDFEIIQAMSDGDGDAMQVIQEILSRGPHIDTCGQMGGLGPMFVLDNNGVYGKRIWLLYKNVCREDIKLLLAVLRARQLGIISTATFITAVDTGEGVDPEKLLVAVQERLSNFGKA